VGGSVDFDEFVAAYSNGLFKTAFLVSRDRGRAEDLVQETWIKAYRHWSRVCAVERPDLYVRRILLREYLGWRRRMPSREVIGFVQPERGEADVTASIVDRDYLWTLIAELPVRQRTVVVLRYFEDLPDDQISRILGCAQSTVRGLAARALVGLRTRIDRPDLTPIPHRETQS
jgi:RNA polymerase sigma-70 factor (sigma-E family)